mmetsp:Transcript_11613/g.26502  ORF Transcript_11613/g.26502 Transcript_11613/m.26502 type:complete len:259 (-) Transcript_11613:795-1571(-)
MALGLGMLRAKSAWWASLRNRGSRSSCQSPSTTPGRCRSSSSTGSSMQTTAVPHILAIISQCLPTRRLSTSFMTSLLATFCLSIPLPRSRTNISLLVTESFRTGWRGTSRAMRPTSSWTCQTASSSRSLVSASIAGRSSNSTLSSPARVSGQQPTLAVPTISSTSTARSSPTQPCGSRTQPPSSRLPSARQLSPQRCAVWAWSTCTPRPSVSRGSGLTVLRTACRNNSHRVAVLGCQGSRVCSSFFRKRGLAPSCASL